MAEHFFIARTIWREKAHLLVIWSTEHEKNWWGAWSFPRDQETFWMCRQEMLLKVVWDLWQGTIRVLGTSIEKWPWLELPFLILNGPNLSWKRERERKWKDFFLHRVFFTCFKTPLEGLNNLSWQPFKVGRQILIYSFLFLILLARNSFDHLENISVCIRQNYWCMQSTRWLINKNF